MENAKEEIIERMRVRAGEDQFILCGWRDFSSRKKRKNDTKVSVGDMGSSGSSWVVPIQMAPFIDHLLYIRRYVAWYI